MDRFILVMFIIYIVGFLLLLVLALYEKNYIGIWRKELYTTFTDRGFEFSSCFLTDIELRTSERTKDLPDYDFSRSWNISRDGYCFHFDVPSHSKSSNPYLTFSLKRDAPIEVYDDLKGIELAFFRTDIVLQLENIQDFERREILDGYDFVFESSNLLLPYLILKEEKAKCLIDYLSLNVVKAVSNFRETFNFDVGMISPPVLLRWCEALINLLNVLSRMKQEVPNDVVYWELRRVVDWDMISPLCVICGHGIEMNRLKVTPCCFSVGHEDHLRFWKRTQGCCKFCQSYRRKSTDRTV